MSERNKKSSDVDMNHDTRESAVKQKLAYLREELIRQKEQIQDIKDLIKKEIETHDEGDLWEFSEKELDQEMGNLLSFMNEDFDCTVTPEITSHRKLVGGFIVFIKKMIKRIIVPVVEPYFIRQKRFNQNAVRFQLASFIRLRRMEQKLEGIEQIVTEIEKQQGALLDAVRSFSGKSGENGPKR